LIAGWGNEEKAGKVTMQFASPPKIRMDCYWSGANVTGESRLPLSQWVHLVHTYREGDSRVYVNGFPDGFSSSPKNPLFLKNPVGMWIGGWKDDYWFTGAIDEVRVSGVARSADWIRMQFENQKPLQTLVGTLVPAGNEFAVSMAKIDIAEGKSIKVSAQAGGAQKVYWIIKRDGKETVVATDRFTFYLEAGRVSGDQPFILQFRAVFAGEVKTIDIPVLIRESIPDPVFSLRAPSQWNGRDPVEIVPVIKNLASLKNPGSGTLKYRWTVSGGAVIKKELSDRLVLLRSQFSGNITVGLALDNGGAGSCSEVPVVISEPATDAWGQRVPAGNEKPVENQFCQGRPECSHPHL
jgi:hypothetical protein